MEHCKNCESTGHDICGTLGGSYMDIDKKLAEFNKKFPLLRLYPNSADELERFVSGDIERWLKQTLKQQKEKIEAKRLPMGVSQWHKHGKKHGYVKYFEAKIREEILDTLDNWAEKWKEGKCESCSGKVLNWNCKQHAYLDLQQKIKEI